MYNSTTTIPMSAKIAWVLLTMIVLIPFSDFICLVLIADLFSETGLVKCGFFISNSGALLSPIPAPHSYPPTTLHVWNDYIPQARSQSECDLSNTSTC